MRVRILTCNLRRGRANADALMRLVATESIDIVCAQELSIRLADRIAAQLPYGQMAHSQISGGNGLASRYPVQIERLPMPKRDAWIARLSPEHWRDLPRAVEVVNAHISGPHTWPYPPHPVRRRSQLAALHSNFERKADIPHAVFGDFNASPLWPAYQSMVSRYIDGALSAGSRISRVGPTWPYVPSLGIRGVLRIDHCFLHGLSAAKIKRVAMPGSDHFGLVVDIEFL